VRPAFDPPTRGYTGVLYGDEGGSIYLCVDLASWDAMVAAQNAGNNAELSSMVAKGKVIREPVGTRVMVTALTHNSRKVRVLEGPNTEVQAWLPVEFIRKK
jgi:hypothetical protein